MGQLLSSDSEFVSLVKETDRCDLNKIVMGQHCCSIDCNPFRRDINEVDTWGLNLFTKSIKDNKMEEFRHYINKSDLDLNIINEKGENALHIALHHHNIDAAIDLVDKGINVNIVNGKGQLPIIWCLEMVGKVEGIERLIGVLLFNSNLNINKCNKKKESPIFIATIRNLGTYVATILNITDLDLYLVAKNGLSVLDAALISGNEGILRLLIQKWDLNSPRSENLYMNTFVKCVGFSSRKMVKVFVEKRWKVRDVYYALHEQMINDGNDYKNADFKILKKNMDYLMYKI